MKFICGCGVMLEKDVSFTRWIIFGSVHTPAFIERINQTRDEFHFGLFGKVTYGIDI